MSETPPPPLSATGTRQGRKSGRVIWVLVISVVLAGLVLALVWALHAPGFHADEHRTATPAQVAASFHTPPPANQTGP